MFQQVLVAVHMQHNRQWFACILDNRQLAQAPCTLTVEPAQLAPGNTPTIPAGGAIPETRVAVSNAAGQAGLVKAYLGGQKTPLTVVQRLWRLKEGQGVLCPFTLM